MWQPLFTPAPVMVFAGYGLRQVKVDVIFIIKPGSDAITNTARGTGVLIGAKKHVFRIISAGTMQHTGIEGIEP